MISRRRFASSIEFIQHHDQDKREEKREVERPVDLIFIVIKQAGF
jgi:hypothetical protein